MSVEESSRDWPQLKLSDRELQKELQRILTARAVGDPYQPNGEFAANLRTLPRGLRAMGATHWLDISLTLDSITWHFGNFGEPGLVACTEQGLRDLELLDLADCFHDAAELMMPLIHAPEDKTFEDILEKAEVDGRADELNQRAWALAPAGVDDSVIYNAWVRFARAHPEEVFG